MVLNVKPFGKIPIPLILLSIFFIVIPDFLDDFDKYYIDDFAWFALLFPCFICSYYLGLVGGVCAGIMVNAYHLFWFFYEKKINNEVVIDESTTLHAGISLITLSCSFGVGILSEKLQKLNGELRKLALYDSLTGLPNRTFFMGKLTKLLGKGIPVALMFIDLDGFKKVNDNYGHEAGDQLLKDVAQKLNLLQDDFMFVSRLGGDEFTVLISETGIDKTKEKANLIISMLQVRINDVIVSGSIGIVFSKKGDTPSSLLNSADSAMYKAKLSGKNAICFSNS